MQESLSGNDDKGVAVVLRQAFLHEDDDGSVKNILDFLRAIFITTDCADNDLNIPEAIKLAFVRCKEDYTFETLQDSVDSIRDVLAAVSIFIETEKATRIRMGCIEGNEQPAQ